MPDVTHESKHWIALSLALPQYVHLETVLAIRIDDEFLTTHGFGPDTYDGRWMRLPFNVQVGWTRVEKPVHSAIELSFIAAEALDKFVCYKRERPIAETPPTIPETATVAVCVLPVLSPEAARDQQDGLLDIMTLAHCIVAATVRSVRLTTGIALRDLPYRQLSPIVPTLVGTTQADGSVNWGDSAVVMLQHDTDTLISGVQLPDDAVEIVRHAIYQATINRPAVAIRDHVGRAEALTAQGDYAGAIVGFATACEVCLDSLLSALLWETGQTPSAAADGWNNSAAKRAKTRFAPLLGGNWNANTSVPLKTWMDDVAKPRHRIVHSGDGVADGHAAEKARLATNGLFAFVSELLVKRGTEYPKTISLLLGQSSLRRYGGAQTEALLQAHEEHNDRWEREFREWRLEWLDLVWT